jgi:DNA helicase-2/ATP-dependent DNA helicase PcrA
LYISHARSRYHQGEVLYSVRSRFIEEIDPLHLTFRGGAPGGQESQLSVPARPRTATRIPAWRAPAKPAASEGVASDPMPRYEDESQDHVHLHVGLAVTHETFGQGRIVALDGKGSEARAVVDFKSVGRKQLLLKFAHLRTGT